MYAQITKRPLAQGEKSQLRKRHWLTVPILFFIVLILSVANVVNDIPIVVYYIALIICGLVVLYTFVKLFQVEKEIKQGEVEVVKGVLLEKVKTGGFDKISITASSGSAKSTHTTSTYSLKIGDENYLVYAKMYSQVQEGELIELVWLPRSRQILSVRTC